MDKELARDLHYKLIEEYDLYDCPVTNSEVRDLIIETLNKNKQYWLNRAIDIVASFAGEQVSTVEKIKAIKELKK